MSNMPDIEVARYALRTFNVADRLMPVAIPVDAWEGGVCEAKCERVALYAAYARASYSVLEDIASEANHEAPAENCVCGIYGCLTIERLKRQYPLECMRVVAVIAVEGDTIIGDIGLRTQAARIVAYWSPKREVRKICADTCDGAIGFAKLNDMLAAYGFEPAGSSETADDLLRLFLAPPSRPRLTRFGRLLFWANVVGLMVNLGFFVAGLFTSAEMDHQLVNLGAAALCALSFVIVRRSWRRVDA